MLIIQNLEKTLRKGFGDKLRLQSNKSDLAGSRTQDPLLKREMLYQLSYQINLLNLGCKYNIKY